MDPSTKAPPSIKAVTVGRRRYIVCRNLNEAREDAKTREAVLATLRTKLRKGDKTLVGNSAYRCYLKTSDQAHFTIDEARVAPRMPRCSDRSRDAR